MGERDKNKKRRGGNNRGNIAEARAQALKDISKHHFDSAPELNYRCSTSEEVGYWFWTATQLSKDRSITYLNRMLGL